MNTQQERYFCANCLTVGELNQHGRCAKCDSNSVVSENVIKTNPTVQQMLNASRQVTEQLVDSFVPRTPKVFPSLTLYRIEYGPFYCTIFAENAQRAKEIADKNIENTWQLSEGQHVDGYFDFTEMHVEAVDRTKRVLLEEKA